VKRRTFYHFSLSIPYLVLIVSGVITYLSDGFSFLNETPGSFPGIFIGVMVFYTMAGIIWGPLYTWMVIVMLFWSRGKSTDDIRRLYLLSPVLLACSMGIPVLITDPATSGKFILEGILRMNNLGFAVPALVSNLDREMAQVIGFVWLFMAAISIVVGYAFVGIMVWVERGLDRRGKFKEEIVPPPVHLS
jgi:hypothetical protein